jgi:hypothetical protein
LTAKIVSVIYHTEEKELSMLWFILIMAVVAAVYGMGMVASIIGYFFLFIGLGVAALVALIVVGAFLADRG